MATKRFGYLDDFTLKNTNVGIGTSTPQDKMEVIGGTRSQDIKVTGIATLTSYQGFQNTKTSYVENITIDSGESGTLSEIVVGTGLTISVGTGATTGQGNIKSLKVSNTFTPPIGGIDERPSAPQPGVLYYNKDFKTVEYWDGKFWRQVDNTIRTGRALFGYGTDGSNLSSVEYITIPTKGNSQDFGNGQNTVDSPAGTSNSIRGIFAGGYPLRDTIEYYTLASKCNAIDFGNLSDTRSNLAACASSIRALFMGGYKSPAQNNIIEFVEISTLGNATDFGDLITASRNDGGAFSSPTRGILGGGHAPGILTRIEFVTIASTGNANDFGDLNRGRTRHGGCANSVRGFWGGGDMGNNDNFKSIEHITIASTGNGEDFGELTVGRRQPKAASSQTRGVWGGGESPGYTNVLDYITIDTAGNAEDFGDLSNPRASLATCSDSHGGLGGF